MKPWLIQWLILVIITIPTVSLLSQSYHPMPISGAQWNATRCWFFYPGGWHDEYAIKLSGQDTSINGHVYKKLVLVTHHAPGTEFDSTYTHILGAMREANKKVFFICEYQCNDTIERMVYDFNPAEPGDTIYTQVLSNGLTQFIPHIVTSLDSVLIGNEYHRRINLRDKDDFYTESWTEGVGSNLGLTYASYWLLSDNSYDLNCFYNEGELQYTNPQPSYGFCNPPFPEVECNPLTTSIPSITQNDGFKIYPNPASDMFNIETTSMVKSVVILNAWGQQIKSYEFSYQLDIQDLSPGFYFVRCTGISGKVIGIKKLIKM